MSGASRPTLADEAGGAFGDLGLALVGGAGGEVAGSYGKWT